jgi:methylthioribose-1-phosphate isomerase
LFETGLGVFFFNSQRQEAGMKINGEAWRPIWLERDGWSVGIIDQTVLPFRFKTDILESVDDAAHAIREMQVRGAPLIGATAAYGLALAMQTDSSDSNLEAAYSKLLDTRPTAVNLRWALDDMAALLRPLAMAKRKAAAYRRAAEIVEEDVETNRRIGEHGLALMRAIAARKGQVNVLTHCNAGWLATCDWGTATSPIYQAFDEGIDVHVWVDETRPRNQGGHLTAWELRNHGVRHTVIVDNAGGHLMQHGQVDLCLVGTDRTTATGDVCNKIGTYLKALAAADTGVPFYVCLPSTTIDWTVRDGHAEIPIEERDEREVTDVMGLAGNQLVRTRVVSPQSAVANPAFDVTPARLVTGLITERGVAQASEDGLRALFPEQAAA